MSSSLEAYSKFSRWGADLICKEAMGERAFDYIIEMVYLTSRSTSF